MLSARISLAVMKIPSYTLISIAYIQEEYA